METTAPRRHRILMCPPDHFSVDYVINPWMEGNTQRPDIAKVRMEWEALRRQVAARADVEVMTPLEGVPDLVFTANAGLVLGNRAVNSHFRHEERRNEEPVNKAWFESHGYEVTEMPRGVYFEGAGDALFDRGTDRLWIGYGFRTVHQAGEILDRALDVDVVALRLVDERFYHLDTCFCPLEGGRLVYYPGAFDERARRTIEELVPSENRFAVGERDAVHFACNAVDTGRSVILNNCTPELERQLVKWGFEVVRTPLTQFIMSGGSAKCLTLRLSEERRAPRRHAPTHVATPTRVVTLEGHLLDTGLLGKVMETIEQAGGSFETLEFRAGQRREDRSYIRLSVSAPAADLLDSIVHQLVDRGAVPENLGEQPARLMAVERDGVAPDDFYCTTIYPTDVLVGGQWVRARDQRMDGMLVVDESRTPATATVTLLRDLKQGQKVVVGVDGIRLEMRTEVQEDPSEFKFMSSGVSSERRVELAVDAIAWEMRQIRDRGGKIVLVGGPVVVHTGGIPYVCSLVRQGYIQAVLSGNALAVHDIERSLYGTSLGVDLNRGVTVHGGHRHHLTAINAIRRAGSIVEAVKQGVLASGLMFELVKHDIPFCLAGSIRDDGPLPDTVMDLVQAQSGYQRLLRGADMIIMLSTMLHSIGVGNMTPAGVRLVCVDINTAVATKLADRGSIEATPVVTDVGLFLNLLVRKLGELTLAPVEL